MSELLVREITPHGSGGVAVIAVEGPGAWERVRELVPALAQPSSVPRLVRLARGAEALDEALALVESRERVELHLHGSPPLVRRVLALLGAREGADAPAKSLEERAAALLENAPCEAGARILLDQIEGALRAELEAIARVEATEARARIAALSESSRRASFALEPRRVVLAGPVNAGKSTLFNALYGRRRVVVSAHEGTTRDVVGERVSFGAWPVDLFDTAGERELDAGAASEIEREGQRLARETRDSADLVVWLQPHLQAAAAPRADSRTRVVLTHADDAGDPAANPPRISALLRAAEAVTTIHALFENAFALAPEPWSALQPIAFDARGRRALTEAREALDGAARADWRAPLSALLGRA